MIRAVLAHYGASDIKERKGWQPVHCPFHGDDHQSASVNLDYDSFHCHGCDMAGSPVRLIMLQEGVSRSEAEQFAARVVADFGGDVQPKPLEGRGLSGKPRSFSRLRGW